MHLGSGEMERLFAGPTGEGGGQGWTDEGAAGAILFFFFFFSGVGGQILSAGDRVAGL